MSFCRKSVLKGTRKRKNVKGRDQKARAEWGEGGERGDMTQRNKGAPEKIEKGPVCERRQKGKKEARTAAKDRGGRKRGPIKALSEKNSKKR